MAGILLSMGSVEATLSFQKLHRKLQRLDVRHERALIASTELLIDIIKTRHMSGPTTATSISQRSSDLYKSVRLRGSGVRTVNRRYYFGSIHFGTAYASCHISKYPKWNSPYYPTRVHWGDISERHFPRLKQRFRDAWSFRA